MLLVTPCNPNHTSSSNHTLSAFYASKFSNHLTRSTHFYSIQSFRPSHSPAHIPPPSPIRHLLIHSFSNHLVVTQHHHSRHGASKYSYGLAFPLSSIALDRYGLCLPRNDNRSALPNTNADMPRTGPISTNSTFAASGSSQCLCANTPASPGRPPSPGRVLDK